MIICMTTKNSWWHCFYMMCTLVNKCDFDFDFDFDVCNGYRYIDAFVLPIYIYSSCGGGEGWSRIFYPEIVGSNPRRRYFFLFSLFVYI
jgi:hypothetical protein